MFLAMTHYKILEHINNGYNILLCYFYPSFVLCNSIYMASEYPQLPCLSPEFTVKSIDNLKIGDVLGKGNFGTVYQVTDPRTEKTYALKKFTKSTMRAKDIESVRNEITILCQLQPTCDPYLVCYEGYIEDSLTINLIMENLQGFRPFARPVDSETFMDIIINLVKGLELIHTHGIAHRDIKPDNILCKGTTIKYVDFGLACHQICSKTIQGTGYFLGPDAMTLKLENQTQVSAYQKLDIWALGATLYKLIVGQAPLELGLTYYLEMNGLSLSEWKAKLITLYDLLKAFSTSYEFPLKAESNNKINSGDSRVIEFDLILRKYSLRRMGKMISIERMLQRNPCDRSMYVNEEFHSGNQR